MGLTLREVRDEDLPLLFEQWADPVAVHMAAFTAPDHMDGDAFERRWSRLRADETVLTRVIVVDDEVAGTIGSWGDFGEREVTYWIGRSYWGKGIATDALNAFLAVERSRPLHARVASDNVASRLEKCGFGVIATERNVAEARSAEIEELVLRLDELASPGSSSGRHESQHLDGALPHRRASRERDDVQFQRGRGRVATRATRG
jgi:RimJ/RimL family protein N-acetyltransferase